MVRNKLINRMKITETHEFNNRDHEDASNITIEVKTNDSYKSISIGEGEPEDMYLFRDLSDAYSIVDLIKLAYQAGKKGEEFDYEFIEEKDY